MGRWDQAAGLLAEADRIVGSPETAMVYRAAYSMEYLAGTGEPGFEALWERVRRTVSGSPLSDDLVTILQGALTFLAFAGRTDDALAVVRQAVDLCRRPGHELPGERARRVAAWVVADAVLADRTGSAGAPVH